jgi:hypothetical protein
LKNIADNTKEERISSKDAYKVDLKQGNYVIRIEDKKECY